MNRRYKVLFLLACFGIAARSANAADATEMIFPVYANTNVQNCRFWISVVTLFNPHSTATTVSYSGYDSAGNVTETGAVSVNPFMNGVIQVRRTGIQWVKVTAPNVFLGREVLQVLDGCPTPPPPGELGIADVRTRVDMAPSTVGHHHFVNISFNSDFGLNTGFSVVFPTAGTTAAKGKLVHRNVDGVQVSEKEVTIAPNGQLVGMISDLLPDSLKAGSTISGSLEVSFDVDVAVAALQFGFAQALEENVLQSMSGTIQ